MIHTRCLSQRPSVRKMSSYESKPVTIASADVFFAAGIRIVGSGTEKGLLIPYSRSFFTKIPYYPASRIPLFFFFFNRFPEFLFCLCVFSEKVARLRSRLRRLGRFRQGVIRNILPFAGGGGAFAVVELPMKSCLRFFTINE